MGKNVYLSITLREAQLIKSKNQDITDLKVQSHF